MIPRNGDVGTCVMLFVGTAPVHTITDPSVILEGPCKRWHSQRFWKGQDIYNDNVHRISTKQCNCSVKRQMHDLC